MDMSALLALYLGIVNAAAFFAMAFDKGRAMAGGRRVPERRLLTYAAVGGSPGALLARHVLRHKTRKQPFVNRLRAIVAVQAVGLGALVWVLLR